jgi:putative transposase
MRLINPQSGKGYFQKHRRRYEEPNQPRELTFSCYHRYPFLSRPRVCEWFAEAIETARAKIGMQLWAYVLMPEHVHLLVYPSSAAAKMPGFLKAVKEPVARKAIKFLKANAPEWLDRLKVKEATRIRYRFWQPGGGYDRNVIATKSLRSMIDYIHANPVRRGSVTKPEDWEWSSARWYANLRPVRIEMDKQVLIELARAQSDA